MAAPEAGLPELTTYSLDDGVATIAMDDGKVNALSIEMLGEIKEQLDQAESDEAVVVLTGRGSTLSAGFDLQRAGGLADDAIGGRARPTDAVVPAALVSPATATRSRWAASCCSAPTIVSAPPASTRSA